VPSTHPKVLPTFADHVLFLRSWHISWLCKPLRLACFRPVVLGAFIVVGRSVQSLVWFFRLPLCPSCAIRCLLSGLCFLFYTLVPLSSPPFCSLLFPSSLIVHDLFCFPWTALVGQIRCRALHLFPASSLQTFSHCPGARLHLSVNQYSRVYAWVSQGRGIRGGPVQQGPSPGPIQPAVVPQPAAGPCGGGNEPPGRAWDMRGSCSVSPILKARASFGSFGGQVDGKSALMRIYMRKVRSPRDPLPGPAPRQRSSRCAVCADRVRDSARSTLLHVVERGGLNRSQQSVTAAAINLVPSHDQGARIPRLERHLPSAPGGALRIRPSGSRAMPRPFSPDGAHRTVLAMRWPFRSLLPPPPNLRSAVPPIHHHGRRPCQGFEHRRRPASRAE